MGRCMSYWLHDNQDWQLVPQHTEAWQMTEKFIHCAACHKFLDGHAGPKLALCEICYLDQENRHTNYVIRRIFGQS